MDLYVMRMYMNMDLYRVPQKKLALALKNVTKRPRCPKSVEKCYTWVGHCGPHPGQSVEPFSPQKSSPGDAESAKIGNFWPENLI